MAEYFLTKSQINLSQCLKIGGGLALESYGALHQILLDRVSPAAAALFAEPLISRGNDTAPASVSWYTSLAGEGRPLSDLEETEQAKIGAILSRELRAIRDLLSDPEDGPLVAAGLHVAGNPKGDVWVIDGQPVIINWGMLPSSVGLDVAARTAHFGATLGRFLPLAAAPPLTEAERNARNDLLARRPEAKKPAGEPASASEVVPSPAAILAPPAGEATPAAAVAPYRLSAYAWAPLAALLLLASLVLVWLLLPNTRIFPETDGDLTLGTAQATALAEEINTALEARRVALRTALDGAVCRADGTLVMPSGLTLDGLKPPVSGNPADAPGKVAPGNSTPVLPPDPKRVQVPERDSADPGSSPSTDVSLLDMIESRTVMVVANGRDGLSTGSGFFVGPDTLVTNFHVVNGADPESIYITNRSLGTLHKAQILKKQGPLEKTGTDFALLRVKGLTHRYFNLLRPTSTLKLQSVVAAGYPGDVLQTDAAFEALRGGNAAAVPDLTVTDGTVNTEQNLSPTTKVVVHSAPISKGNSGGPLIDMCGRVVGVNTFVRQGDLRNLNFALSTNDLLAFLEGSGIQASAVSQPCEPRLLRPSAPPIASVEPVQTPQPATAPGTGPSFGLPAPARN